MPILFVINIVALLIAPVIHAPYGFFMLLRFVTCVSMIVIACQKPRPWLMYSSIALAVLYNPLIKIHLDRNTWGVVNVLTAAFMGVALVILVKSKKKSEDK